MIIHEKFNLLSFSALVYPSETLGRKCRMPVGVFLMGYGGNPGPLSRVLMQLRIPYKINDFACAVKI